MASDSSATSVLLLKTKSTPSDGYEDIFASSQDGPGRFETTFVPVLQHRFEEAGMNELTHLLQRKQIHNGPEARYGGLIFTSQRAVEAFAHLVEEGKGGESWPHLQSIPIYSVGPATTRALSAVRQTPPLQIYGEHTGNGDALAQYILEHYAGLYADRVPKPALLFLVGEQRRDIIPKTLMDPSLPDERRIHVTETVVYGTGVMPTFLGDFQKVLEATAGSKTRWVVVFSPTGCDSMFDGLGWIDDTNGRARVKPGPNGERDVFIATIGPTTRDYLKSTFDFEPDVCALKPSPQGIWEGITNFMRGKQLL